MSAFLLASNMWEIHELKHPVANIIKMETHRGACPGSAPGYNTVWAQALQRHNLRWKACNPPPHSARSSLLLKSESSSNSVPPFS